ncbi:tRNA (guanosine(46)-N7)-methyltransferase TrmB [Alkaliphilus serpentinus]|uniref:tRNA (guanine-N(7)-)-methyltransferase n=1 Tax=Alkaliphilus serpentinus TaxID=1482731 RepID=A0A833M9M7_9FIRM|nr:tRNA (guanosine(46)-N7)-methyltransferase TrmB [Alkaliphilus serpentinus]KAB3530258.1 tRNA (guanosine(46)-N7)-methyltransferase TrmB [Alkaliphilus serpentinus]
MRVRNIPGVDNLLREFSFFVDSTKSKGSFRKRFNNENPIHIEIGMGKGKFIMTLAEKNPHINYVGIEKSGELLYKAAREVEEKGLNNLLLTKAIAEEIEDFFLVGEIQRIYLNFSDPWPKKRHEKRRLTHSSLLVKYKKILPPKGEIHFKTDGLELFEFTLDEMRRCGLKLMEVIYDLHKEKDLENIMTEYEEKFFRMGKAIYKCVGINE